MCLILFAWQADPRYALIVAANRDEFHQRPTDAAGFWADNPAMLAGKDTQAGGTWLGVTRSGRFSAITNYREPMVPELELDRSRGHLVRDFLLGQTAALAHARELAGRGDIYRGFNLLVAAGDELAYVSNRGAGPEKICPGVHGLSNHLLNTDWPKVHVGRERLGALIEKRQVSPETLFDLLTDRLLTPGDLPRNIGDNLVREQLMNHYFIVSPEYGTRSSTVLLVGHDGQLEFAERQFAPDGKETDTNHFRFSMG